MLVDDSDIANPSSIIVRMKTYLFFNSNIVNFVWKTDEGKAAIIVLLIFLL